MGVIENMKEVADLVKKVGDIELYRKIVELEGEVIELTREKRQLEQKVEELERGLDLKRSLVFRDGFYWTEGDQIPYCPRCWESSTRAVHLFFAFRNEETTRWDCPECKQTYLLKTGRPYTR